jgi:hypothetical protein
MNIAAKTRCVVKHPGDAPKIVACDGPRDLFDDAASCVPFNRAGSQLVFFDDAFVLKNLPPNIMHPTYRVYYELCGPVVIVGTDHDGDYRSLDEAEAEQVCFRLRELSVPSVAAT